MPIRKEATSEPIPGYRLLEQLGQGGYGEVWKCEAPGGLNKAIKFVYGNLHDVHSNAVQVDEELQAIERIKAIRHPYLLSIDRVEHVEGELLIVTELADKNLYDLWVEHRKANAPGIPRDQLLSYLLEAAEVLDLLNVSFDLQHLDVKPQNLFLISNHVKVGDFGLVSQLSTIITEAAPTQHFAVSPLYSPPELFKGQVHRQSDQYSLAITYQQLLTGDLPFQGKSFAQCMMMHCEMEPDVSPLPLPEQHIVAHALSKNPAERYPTCKAFVQALVNVVNDPSAYRDSKRLSASTVMKAKRAPATDPMLVDMMAQGRELIAGLQGVECRSADAMMDQWLATNGKGGHYRLQRIYGMATSSAYQRKEIIKRLLTLNGPYLSSRVFSEDVFGRILACSPEPQASLQDRYLEYRSQQLPGIPRWELLQHLGQIAPVLDDLATNQGAYHLRLSPEMIAIHDQEARIDQMGLAQFIWLPAGFSPRKIQNPYSAPEVGRGEWASTSDQYSLALMVVSLMTGRSLECRRLPGQGWDLEDLSEQDQTILERALDVDPDRRFSTCCELIEALDQSTTSMSAALSGEDEFTRRVTEANQYPRPSHLTTSTAALDVVRQLLAIPLESEPSDGSSQELIQPLFSASRNILSHHFSTSVSLEEARLKLDVIRQLWQGELRKDADRRYVFRIQLPGSFRSKQPHRPQGLVIGIRMKKKHAFTSSALEISVRIKPRGVGKKRGARLLEIIGFSLLEQVQNALRIGTRNRSQERLELTCPLRIQPFYSDGSTGDWIGCRGRDLSMSGVGFFMPSSLPTVDINVKVPATPTTPEVILPATIVRAKLEEDGWYQIGAVFCLAEHALTSPDFCLDEISAAEMEQEAVADNPVS